MPVLAFGARVCGGRLGASVVGTKGGVGLFVGLGVGGFVGARVLPQTKLLSKSQTFRNSLNIVPPMQVVVGETTLPSWHWKNALQSEVETYPENPGGHCESSAETRKRAATAGIALILFVIDK